MKALFILLIALVCTFYCTNLPAETPNSIATKDSINISHPNISDEPVFPPEELIRQPSPETNKFFTEFLNMLASLGLIIALILIAAWFLKRMLNTRLEQANNTSAVKILERRALSPKTALYLLEIEDKNILIAESHNGLIKLTEFPSACDRSENIIEESDSKFSKLLDNKK